MPSASPRLGAQLGPVSPTAGRPFDADGDPASRAFSNADSIDNNSDEYPNEAPDDDDGLPTTDDERVAVSSPSSEPRLSNTRRNPRMMRRACECTYWLVDSLLESKAVAVVLLCLTIYILFANDMRMVVFTSEVDGIFEVLSTICFFVFAVELVLRSLLHSSITIEDVEEGQAASDEQRRDASPVEAAAHSAWRVACLGRRRKVQLSGYFLSFLFCLDVIATVSLLPEIGWIWSQIGDTNSGSSSNTSSSSTSSQLSTARASRISRLGSRLGRIIRMVRVVRLFKLYTLWRKAGGSGGSPRSSSGGAKGRRGDGGAESPPSSLSASSGSADVRESQIGQRLSDSTTRTVILLVLIMLLLIPLFIYVPDAYGHEEGAALIHAANTWRGPGWDATVRHIRQQLDVWDSVDHGIQASDDGQPQLVRVDLQPSAGVPDGLALDRPETYRGLRNGTSSAPELQKYHFAYFSPDNVTYTTEVWYNVRPPARQDALNTLGLTIFIVVLLLVGALQFTADAQALVLRPIEGMIAFVERISFDASDGGASVTSRDNTGSYETKVLENTIKKIVGVLRVGFGTSGMAIVARHLGPASANSAPLPPQSVPVSSREGSLSSAAVAVASASASSALLTSGPGRPRRPSVLASAGTGEADVQTQQPQKANHSPSVAVTSVTESASASSSMATNATISSGKSSNAAPRSIFDPFRRGKVVRAVFASVRIPHADVIVDVLQEDAVPYFNRISKVVHDTALAWGGSIVSNSHDGYTLAWVVEEDKAGGGGGDDDQSRWDATDGGGGLSQMLSRRGSIAGAVPRRARRVSLASLASIELEQDASSDADATDAARGSGLHFGRRSIRAGGNGTQLGHWSSSLLHNLQQHRGSPVATTAATTDGRGTPSVPRDSGSATDNASPAGSPVFGGPPSRERRRRNSTAFEVIRASREKDHSDSPVTAGSSSASGVKGSASSDEGEGTDVAAGSEARLVSPHAASASASVASGLASGSDDGGGGVGRTAGNASTRHRRMSMSGLITSVLHTIAGNSDSEAARGGRNSSNNRRSLSQWRGRRHSHDASGPRSSSVGAAAPSSAADPPLRPSSPRTAASQRRASLLDFAAETADRALIACLKTIAALRRSRDVQESAEATALRRSPQLAGHRLPYLQFGLHAGWAVEGAIGSMHRVDPLCISGHVLTSAALSAQAGRYGVPIVMSSPFQRLLSGVPRRYTRPIDSVTIVSAAAGWTSPPSPPPPHLNNSTGSTCTAPSFSLYTFDVWDWAATMRPGQLVQAVKTNAVTRAARAGQAERGVSVTPFAGEDCHAPPGLLPFAHTAQARRPEADLFNVAQQGTPDADRRISILGAADIIEHPVEPCVYDRGLFDVDPELWALRAPFSAEFRSLHGKAVSAYALGRWDVARRYLERANATLPGADEGAASTSASGDSEGTPTTGSGGAAAPAPASASAHRDPAGAALLTFMGAHDFSPPSDWGGRRTLVA